MTDEKLFKELEELKHEVEKLKAGRNLKSFWIKAFTKTNALIGILLTFVVSSIIVYAATISKPYTFTDGTVISADEINSNIDMLYTESNTKDSHLGVLESYDNALNTRLTNLEAHDHGLLELNYIISSQGLYVPPEGAFPDETFVGQICLFAGTWVPSGFFRCNGQLLPISSYTAFFSIIGTRFGGNGTTNFAVPDLRGDSSDKS